MIRGANVLRGTRAEENCGGGSCFSRGGSAHDGLKKCDKGRCGVRETLHMTENSSPASNRCQGLRRRLIPRIQSQYDLEFLNGSSKVPAPQVDLAKIDMSHF